MSKPFLNVLYFLKNQNFVKFVTLEFSIIRIFTSLIFSNPLPGRSSSEVGLDNFPKCQNLSYERDS